MDIASLDYRAASEAGEPLTLLGPDGTYFPGIDGKPVVFVLYGPQSVVGLQVLARIRKRAGASDFSEMTEDQVAAELEKDAAILLPLVKSWPENIEHKGAVMDMSDAGNQAYVMGLFLVWTQVMKFFRRAENFTPEPWRKRLHGSNGTLGHPVQQKSKTGSSRQNRAGRTSEKTKGQS